MEKYLHQLPINVYIYVGAGSDPIPERKALKDTMEWLHNDAKDMSFNGIADDIQYQSQITSITFKYNAEDVSVKYSDGLVFEFSNKTVNVSEDDFFKVWDYIRNEGVFISDPAFEKSLVYVLLLQLGYLSKIRIKDAKSDKMLDGYQLNEGLGRAYGLKEC